MISLNKRLLNLKLKSWKKCQLKKVKARLKMVNMSRRKANKIMRQKGPRR